MNHDLYLERRIPEFINEINGMSLGKFGKPCNIKDYKNLSHFPVYFIYQFPISGEARQEMIRLSIDSKMPVYTTLSSETKDKRKIFVEMNKFVPVIKILNKKFEYYEFYLLYSITPSLPANNKSIYIAVKSKSAVSFYNAEEEYNMYNDELDMTLENAYNEGYQRALSDISQRDAKEDVGIFDENYFTAATESSSDIVFDMRDFNYMPKSEAEKAYKGTIQRLIRTDYIPTKNSNINPHKMYITKGDLGWWYGISAFKELIRAINKIHMNRYKKSSDFLADVDEIIRRYDVKVDQVSRYATATAAGAMAGYYSHY